jgi:hypothetical protein
VLAAPLNGRADGVSFSIQSAGFPDHYLAIANASSGAVGIVGPSPDVDDATWTFAAGLAPAPPNTTDSFTLVSQSKLAAWAGKLLTATTAHNGPCVYADPAGDVVLTDGSAYGAARSTWIVGRMPPVPPAPMSFVAVDAATVTNAAVNRKIMGCHHDYGFAQAPRGFYAEMVYGTSFDAGTQRVSAWHPFWINSSAAAPLMTDYTSFSGRPTLGLSLDHDFATLGMANRGIGNAGLFLQAGMPYSVEFWAWCGAGAGNEPTVYVELVDFTNGNASLARADVKLVSSGPPWGTNWVHFNVTLTPSAGTQCVGIPFDSDPSIDCGGNAGPAHVCVRCGGEFRIALTGPQSYGGINLAYASLKPGAWGLVTAKDGSSIDVLKSAGDVLTAMGVTLMRNGGSVSQSMRWTDWRGPRWNRPSAQQVWGFSLLSGWGPFEFADLGAALDIEPVITLAYDSNDAVDFADLVEYCWGDAVATSWGARRAADGHPAIYNITVFELGNEQINPFFVEQVVAMEARSKAVGSPPLYYMYPQNGGVSPAQAQALLDRGVDPARILPDLHVGAGGAAEEAAGLFASPPVAGFTQGAINAETNAGTHDMTRALDEAADLIDWFNTPEAVASRLYARTASFCSGTSNNYDSWDQGISFFLPNMWVRAPRVSASAACEHALARWALEHALARCALDVLRVCACNARSLSRLPSRAPALVPP